MRDNLMIIILLISTLALIYVATMGPTSRVVVTSTTFIPSATSEGNLYMPAGRMCIPK